jgi:hypothetical protein
LAFLLFYGPCWPNFIFNLVTSGNVGVFVGFEKWYRPYCAWSTYSKICQGYILYLIGIEDILKILNDMIEHKLNMLCLLYQLESKHPLKVKLYDNITPILVTGPNIIIDY